MSVEEPIIIKIDDNINSLNELYKKLEGKGKKNTLIKEYPIVYIHNWENNGKNYAYVGESNNLYQRTGQHYAKMNDPKSWQKNLKNKNASLYVIAHPEFHKSLTLDIENELIRYLSSSSSFEKVYNGKFNPQNKYYKSEDLNEIFCKIWKKLRKMDSKRYLLESEIRNSPIYKASPLHKLNSEQKIAKEKILSKIYHALADDKDNSKLIWVQGDAGTGKTVLMSSMFYELLSKYDDDTESEETLDAAFIVNNDEQLKVYKEIIKKLNLIRDRHKVVFNPTQFINQFIEKKNSPIKRTKSYDVVFVDEAHLLLTRKNQAFTGEHGQLVEIIKHAKVVVVMFDKRQIMNAEQYLSDEEIKNYEEKAKSQDNFVELTEQMRMNANPEVMKWLRNFYIDGIINPLTKKRGKYEIKIFDTPFQLEKAIQKKEKNKSTKLSRIIATYDWKYNGENPPKDEKYWNVKIGDWVRPWNKEIIRYSNKKETKAVSELTWSEQPQTINEVGSIYTIHGFDLSYAGVILGPSIKYRDGHIVYDPSCSFNEKAKQKRKLKDGSKKSFCEIFLNHELGVLLTRGVNGLYIYACDEELREILKKCV